MGIISFDRIKIDKNYIICLFIAFGLAIIFGVVLFKIANIGDYFVIYAQKYVDYIFSFNNGALFFSQFLREACYLYAFFLLAYFTRFKYASSIILFFRTVICVFYCAVFFSSFGFGGVLVAVIIYIPSFILSAAACWFVVESCRAVLQRYVFFYPLALALADCIVFLLLLNVVFRILIVVI